MAELSIPSVWAREPVKRAPGLNRERIVKAFGTPNTKRQFSVVALAPSFNWTKDWQSYGTTVATKETVASTIDVLRNKQFAKPYLRGSACAPVVFTITACSFNG